MTSTRSHATVLRRLLGTTVVLGLLAGSLAFYTTGAQLSQARPGASVADAPPRTAAPVTSDTAPSSPPSPAEPTTPEATPTEPTASAAPSPPAGLPAGPGTTEPGVLVRATPLSDGSFDVAELVLYAAPVTAVALRPPSIAQGGHEFAALQPWASDVQVSAGDDVAMVPDGRVAVPVTVTLEAPTRRVELRYRLRGVTVRSLPSRAGRALAALSPITAASPGGRVAFATPGAAVRNLQCPTLPLAEQACAAGSSPRLHVEGSLPWSKALVLVQLDLPRPS